MRTPLTRLTAALCVLFAPIALLAVPTQAQTPPTPVTVTVNATSSLGKILPGDHGVNTTVGDFAHDPNIAPQLLQNIGANALRYPGGIDADTFNWETPSSTSNFVQFMTLAKNIGASLIITTNYQNPSTGAAGDPTEAANWVAYANLHGYGGQYWEIGNEEWGYGQTSDTMNPHNPVYYGKAVVACAKAMKAQDPSIQVGVVLTNPGQYPDNYTPDWNSNVLKQCGTNIDFVILHYYPLATTLPTDSQLLSAPAPQIPLLVARTRALINQYCGANAAKVPIFITETNSVGSKGTKQVTGLVNSLFVADETQMWMENGVPNVDYWNLHGGIYLERDTNNNLVTDSFGRDIIRDNFFDVGVPDNNYGNYQYADGGLLSWTWWDGDLPYSPYTETPEPTQDTPFANYYGEQMVGLLSGPNDYMVSSAADQSQVSSHAVRNSNGNLSVMLINKDPITIYNAKVVVKGYANSWTVPSTIYFFGQPNFSGIVNSAPSSLSSSPGTGGSSFYQSLQPYSITTVVLNAVPSSPILTASVSPSALTIASGAAPTLTASITNYGSTLPSATVNMSVYDINGNPAGSTQPFTGQSINAGILPNPTPQTFAFTWTPPAAEASTTYKVSVTVTDSTGNIQYSGSNLATIQVAPPNQTIPATPSFSESASFSPSTIMEGQTATVTLTLTDIGASVTDATILGATYGSSRQALVDPITGYAVAGQNWVYGQTNKYTYYWTAPTNVTGVSYLQAAAGPGNNGGDVSYPGNTGNLASITVVAYVAPAFTVAGTVDQSSLAPGATTTIHAAATDIGGPLTNGTGFVEVHDSNGNIVLAQNVTGLNWNTNQTVAFPPITWTAPGTTGSYTVWVGVKDSSGNPICHNSVATINVTPASMAISATATPSTAAPGTIVTINGTATDNGGALSNDIAEIDIYSSSWGAPIGGATYPVQAWNTGQSHSYSTTWTAPGTPGTYYVYMTVKDPSGNPNYGYIPVTTITVPQPVITVANFGFETPGLGNAQYLYRPTGSSWTYPPNNKGVLSNCGIASNGSAFNNLTAPQGSQVAFVQQSGTMSQALTSSSAGVWTISVSAAQRTNSAQTVNVLLDGAKIGSITPTSNPFATYTVTSPSSVSAGSHTLTFQGTTTADNTAFIDNVQVTSH